MAKLVLLSAGMTGRTHELNVDKTTIGRLEDNSFQVTEPSVSSHHCEVLLRGSDVVVKDLNSTNGTYINEQKVSESVLKPGQVLRLGQIEMRLEAGGSPASGAAAAAAPSSSAPPPAPGAHKKPLDQTMVMKRGVNMTELEHGGTKPAGFDTSGSGFSKKDNKVNKIFIIAGVILGVVIFGLLIYVFAIAGKQ